MADRKVDTGIIERNGSYRFTVACGMDTNGKQIRKTRTWKPAEAMTEKKADKLAKEKYIEFKNQCKDLSDFNDCMRFADLCEDYMNVFAKNQLKPITAYTYKGQIDNHFIEYFGNMKLKDITTSKISKFFNTHTITLKDGTTKPLTHSTSKKLYTILQSVFTYAVHQGYIKETPCKNVILPAEDTTVDKNRKFMTESEISQFLDMLDKCKYDDFRIMMKFLLYTGVRSGEMLGLQWQDIDFENNVIHIVHTLSDVGGNHFLTTPKTKKSKRYIAMSDTVKALLKEQRKHQLELQLAVKDFPHPEMVFTSANGNYKDRSGLNTSLRRFLKGSNLEFLTLHCLRHSNATLLLNAGVDIKVVSEHLGHSDIGVTADIYADVLDATRRKTADILDFKLNQA